MQLNLGTKIRELRRRDGRTQDNLAEALGVTAQAVSRWESGGSYPDMEMIPAIANYFHISIDELFGYQDDRDKKIQSILDSADKILTKQGMIISNGSLTDDVYDCINMLREASEEFPNESKILSKLANALHMWGWHVHGAHAHALDDSGVYHDDIAYNAKNEYWQEAVRVYERILKCDPTPDERESTIIAVVNLYSQMGEYEKAKAIVMQQNPLRISKEVLLPKATTGEEKEKAEAYRIMNLLHCLGNAIINTLAMRPALSLSEYGKDLYLSVIKVYESIFADGRCGDWHVQICLLYLQLAHREAHGGGSMEKIMEYFDKAFEHYKEYDCIYHQLEKGEEYAYSAPLVSTLKEGKGDLSTFSENFWEYELKAYTKEVLDEIRKNPKYAECFA